MVTKAIYITVRVIVEDTVDVDDFVNNVDYDFRYPGVIDTEITDSREKEVKYDKFSSTL